MGAPSSSGISAPLITKRDQDGSPTNIVSTSKGSMPQRPSQIRNMEKQNNLAINVFGKDKGMNVSDQGPQCLLYNRSNHRERKHFCERYRHGYRREDLLEARRPDCRGIGQTAVRMEMQEEGKKLTFQSHHKQLPVPFIICADFEALNTKVEGPGLDRTKSNTRQTQHHEACSYCFTVVRCDGQTEPPVKYRVLMQQNIF